MAEIHQNGTFLERLRIIATERGKAIRKAQLHFWYTYHGRLGTSDQALVVNDPCYEVNYSDKFSCIDKKNLLLPEEVIVRLLQQARGELTRDTRVKRPHSPRGSVRRLKRRRDFGKFIAPAVRQMKNGKLYYRINTQSQVVRAGRRYHKRKYRDIPLVAQTLVDAVGEIKARKLLKLNSLTRKRRMVCREVRLLEWLSGIKTPPARVSRKFRVILEQYAPSSVAA